MECKHAVGIFLRQSGSFGNEEVKLNAHLSDSKRLGSSPVPSAVFLKDGATASPVSFRQSVYVSELTAGILGKALLRIEDPPLTQAITLYVIRLGTLPAMSVRVCGRPERLSF